MMKYAVESARNNDASGVALIMVLLILSALLAMALSVAWICRSNETSAARTLEQETARRYALSALELAKGRLRRGTYESEFGAAFPSRGALPPDNAADLAPFDTPDFDAAPEMLLPPAELTRAVPRVLPNGDSVSVGVEIEDEQGKLNLNSITPRLLRGLYMAVFRIDPSILSADDRAALEEHFENVLDQIVWLRFSTGKYIPLTSVDQIRGFTHTANGKTWRLTDAEFDALSPYLTVSSWLPSANGFESPSQPSSIYVNDFGEQYVQFTDSFYRIDYFDDEWKLLKTFYLLSHRVPDAEPGQFRTVVALPEEPPSNAVAVSSSVEVLHPINVNTADFNVLLALCLAPLDPADPIYTLADALADARAVRVSGAVKSIYRQSDTWVVELQHGSDDFSRKVPCLVGCGGIYFSAVSADPTHLSSADDLSALLIPGGEPLVATTVTMTYNRLFPSDEVRSTSPLGVYLGLLYRQLICLASYDTYTIRSACSLVSPQGLEIGRWTVTERVLTGGCGKDGSPQVFLDTSADFSPYYSRTADPQRRRIARSWMSDRARNAFGSAESVPPFFWISPYPSSDGRLDTNTFLSTLVMYSSTNVSAQIRPPAKKLQIFDAEGNLAADNPGRRMIYTRPSSCIQVLNTDAEAESSDAALFATDLSTPISANPLAPSFGNFAVGGWFKAQGWDPASSADMHRIFTLSPTDARLPGSTQLYVQNGLLTLWVEDDAGVAGLFSYRLTPENFPPETWMYIVCHVGGNQQGQSAILVDNRLAPLEYSTTASRPDGYCCSIPPAFLCRPATIAADADADPATLDVDSTDGFPDNGYIRVDDEIIAYGSRTPTSFTALTRRIAGTSLSTLAEGTRARSAVIIQDPFQLKKARLPAAGDIITLIPYLTAPPNPIKAASPGFLRAKLDMNPIDTGTGYVLCAPLDMPPQTALPLAVRFSAYCDTSGSVATGDTETGKISAHFFAAQGMSDGFVGDSRALFLGKPIASIFQLSADIEASDTLPADIPQRLGYPQGMLLLIDEEIAGIVRDELSGNTELCRGLLGTRPTAHSAGSWVLPLPSYYVKAFPTDVNALTTSLPISFPSFLDGGYWLVGNEIMHVRQIWSPVQSTSFYLLSRGAFGSTPASCTKGRIAIQFPCLAPAVYDFAHLADDYGCFQFSRLRPGTRILGLSWTDLHPDPYLLMHFWADVADDQDFTRNPTSPNVFYFNSHSRDFSISRDGEPILTDGVTVRCACEYLRGAWLPDDPTRHSWKALPQIDRIDLWIQESDVVFEHSEHP